MGGESRPCGMAMLEPDIAFLGDDLPVGESENEPARYRHRSSPAHGVK